MISCVIRRLLMLLMIELCVGGYEGLADRSAQECHRI